MGVVVVVDTFFLRNVCVVVFDSTCLLHAGASDIMSSPSQFLAISTDQGSISGVQCNDGYTWHIGYCKYKWNSAQQKMIFYKHTSTKSMSTGFGCFNIGPNTTKEEMDEMIAGQGSVGCSDLRYVKVNGIAGVVTKDENGKEYLVW